MGGVRIGGSATLSAAVATGYFSAPTSTGEHSETGLGFQPSVVIFFGADVNSDNPILPRQPEACVGFMTTTEQRSWAWDEMYAEDPSVTARAASDSAALIKLIADVGGGSFIDYVAEFVSMDADGFTIDFTTAPAFASRIGYIAVRSGVEVGTVTLPSTPAATQTLALGSAPTAIFVFRDDANGIVDGANFAMGWATGTGTDDQGVIAGDSENAAAGGRNSCDLLRSGRVFAQVTDDDALDGSWSLTGFGSTLEFTCEDAGAADVVVLALSGIPAVCGIDQADTGASSQSISAPGTTPLGAMFLYTAKTASTSVRAAQRFGIGAGDALIGDVGMIEGALEDSSEGPVNIGCYVQAWELSMAYEVDTGNKGSLFANGGGFGTNEFTVGWRNWNSGTAAPARAYEFLWLALG